MTDFDDLESMWTRLCAETTADRRAGDDAEDETRARRARCETCGRPSVACPCAHLPAEPAHTRGALIVLTHPNERKRALATGWILPECFRRCAVVTKREPPRELLRMFADEDEDEGVGDIQTDSSAGRASSASSSDAEGPVVPRDVPVYVLYPASNAEDVDRVDPVADREALSRRWGRESEARRETRSSAPASSRVAARSKTLCSKALREFASARDALRGAAYVLIALDSTWRQAREMAAAAMPALPPRTKLVKLPASNADAPGLRRAFRSETNEDTNTSREVLGLDAGSGGDASLSDASLSGTHVSPSTVLRVEPEVGCALTAEACARAMERLESNFFFASGNGVVGEAVPPPSPAGAAVATVRAMARVQSAHDPAMRAGATKAQAGGKHRQRIAAARNLESRRYPESGSH